MIEANTIAEPSGTDADLVARSVEGSRDAFGRIVSRHQTLVCSVAYSICGDIHLSEELAQETFVAAWRQLRNLHEPGKFKSWLCGIARNLACNALRRERRVPTASTEALDEELPGPCASPREEAISREEEAMLWSAIEGLPVNYREPMILFYREQESVRAVAEALDLSEDAVKQRLARGRSILTEHIERALGAALRDTAPGKAFTVAVLAALPPVTMATKAAGIGAIAAKGGALAKGAGLAGLFKVVLGPVLGVFQFWIDYRVNMDDARTPESRRFLRRLFPTLWTGEALFVVSILLLVLLRKPLEHSHPALLIGLWIGIPVAWEILLVISALWMVRRQIRMARAGAALPEPVFEYRSKFNLLGLPLVHIRMRGGLARGPVKAWFAAGDSAIGVIFAFGALAVAPVSCGGFAVGLLAFGPFAMGLASLAVSSVGFWAAGVFAVGWQAFGGVAVGWLAADGGVVATAHHFAQGAPAMAAHANDAAAGVFFKNSNFFQNMLAMTRYANWLNLFLLFPLFVWRRVRILKKKREAKKTQASV